MSEAASGRGHSSVGLVHDYLLTMRGAERTFAAISDCWPDAPIYATLYSADGTEQRFASRDVHTSYLQRLGVRQRGFRRLLPLFPRAVERLPVSEHDILLSSSSAFAHGVRPKAGAVHICYCHSPFRYAWHENELALQEAPALVRPLVRGMLDRIRRWDLAAARRVTHYIANSDITKERIHRFYGRDATVIHPPVEIDWLKPGQPEDFFLVVTELAPHKRVHVALEAARLAGKRITVAGSGPELARLRSDYEHSAEFLGRVSTEELASLYPRALALVVPNVEEFGIAAVEAQAAGRPVVAVNAGGTRETVIDGETGVLLDDGDPQTFAEALREVDFESFSPVAIRTHAEQFSRERFIERFTHEVSRVEDVCR